MSYGHARVPTPLAGKCQSVASGGRTANPVGDQTRKVLIAATDGMHYVLGNGSVTAATSDTYIGPGSEQMVRISPGQYVAAIDAATGGGGATLYVSELAE
ncbi:MAG: hypothetical protein ACPGSI_17435 [Pikeienuella sp.]